MYGMNLLSFFNKSFAVKYRSVVLAFKNIQRNISKVKTSFDLRPKVEKDVVLFNFENSKYFILINVISTVHCISWSYLGLFLFESLDKSAVEEEAKKKFWGKILEVERKYSVTLSAISLIFGWSVFIMIYFYSLRSVRKIILHRGGRDVTIITYNLPGFNTIKTPLTNLSSFAHRTKVKKYIPIKIKNKLFYYLIDIQGEFSNPALFDYTAGIKRNF